MRYDPSTAAVFDESHYACGLARKLRRCFQLGPRYYLWDLPRYFAHRHAMHLPWADFGAVLNPLREFVRPPRAPFQLPERYGRALDPLAGAGVRLTLPPPRLESLVGAWWAARSVAGDVIECGSYRGATGLLLAVLAKAHGIAQTVLLLAIDSYFAGRKQRLSPLAGSSAYVRIGSGAEAA